MDNSENLRIKAEELLKTKLEHTNQPLSEGDMLKLVHELEVHQIELELINQELLLAKEKAEIASEKYLELYDFAPSGYFSLSKEGTILGLNLTGSFMFEDSRSKLIGSKFSQHISPSSKPDFQNFLTKVFTTGVKEFCEIFLRINHKHFCCLYLTGIINPDNNACSITATDITKRKVFEKAFHAEEEQMRLAVSNSPVPVMIHDEDGNILQLSKGWTEYSGYTIQDIPTLSHWTEKAYGSKVGGEKAYIDSLFNLKKTMKNGEWEVKAKDGSIRIWDFQTTPLGKVHESKRVLHSMAIDITDQKKIEHDLLNSKEKAEESDRLKSAFLANMSHEIRTPMNGILGFADLLKTPKLTADKKTRYIDIIEESGERMLNIINDIIDISKIESGLMEIDIEELNINEQIEYIYNFFKPEVEKKGIKLSYNNTLNSKDSIVKTDREKVFAILTNLVKNAIKYSNNGSIELGYHLKDNMLEFYVKDTGIGIPKDRKEAIFERFIQADIEDKMARQGVGLGLSITKSYVEMLGGNIWVESKEGIGSTFYFTLPYTKVN